MLHVNALVSFAASIDVKQMKAVNKVWLIGSAVC